MRPLYEQPYDSELLKRSRLYTQSRKLFLKNAGQFEPSVCSTPRSLSSVGLLENTITYSPVESELFWSMTDKLQKKEKQHFDQIKSLVTNVYHEQNHRNLWHFFTKKNIFCPKNKTQAALFLNLTESLVIALDMALGDELNQNATSSLKQLGIIYDTGFNFMRNIKSKREYRNALQVCVLTTLYLLEGYHPEDIPKKTKKVFHNLESKFIEIITKRALALDVLFVELTNPIWQKKHISKVIKKLSKNNKKAHSLDEITIYKITEDWFDYYNL